MEIEHSYFASLSLVDKKFIALALRAHFKDFRKIWVNGTQNAPERHFGREFDPSQYVLSHEEELIMDAFSNALIDGILAKPKRYLLKNGTQR